MLDWEAFTVPATARVGREIRQHPETWCAYRELVRAVITTMARLPVVLLGVCTPAEVHGWPIDAWVLLDCADDERRRRLGLHARPDHVQDAVRDGREYRLLGLPVIDSTGRTPAAVVAVLVQFVRRLTKPDVKSDLDTWLASFRRALASSSRTGGVAG